LYIKLFAKLIIIKVIKFTAEHIIEILAKMMMFKNMLRFAKVDSLGLTARKYMRSIS
jgi:hypothetical protein